MKTKGISLIVLVITILVLSILAATVVISLSNANIIGQAKNAVNASNLQALKEAINLEVISHMADPSHKGEVILADLVGELNTKGYEATLDNNIITINGADGKVEVTSDGIVREYDPYAGLQIGQIVEYTAQPGEYNVSEKVSTGLESWLDDLEEPVGKQPFSTTAGELEGLTWIYIGKDKVTGKHLITTSEPVNKELKLYGNDTLEIENNGNELFVNELNNLCAALFSSEGHKARSMTIEDVIRILEYTGDKGTYESREDGWITTHEAKTISQLAEENNYDISGWWSPSPERKPLGNYLSNYYEIESSSDDINADRASLVFKNTDYWLASSWAMARFDGMSDTAMFGFRQVSNNNVGIYYAYDEIAESQYNYNAIRPVVEL